MTSFSTIKEALHQQMQSMTNEYSHLFKTAVNKDELWDTYLAAFKPEDNPIYRERTVHDCQCCKQFIRACGNMVAITEDYELVSIWDIEVGGSYQIVADAMANLVKSRAVNAMFLHRESHISVDFNHEMREKQRVLTWEHFYYKLPPRFVNADSGKALSRAQSACAVLQRSLAVINNAAINTILALLADGSLYRGEEHKGQLMGFQVLLAEYANVPASKLELFAWRRSVEIGQLTHFKNSVIGTLATDLAKGIALEDAVRMFESKVAPANYKRTKVLVTPAMITKAKAKVLELGLLNALPRRFAVRDDITVNNVIFADRSPANSNDDIFDKLTTKAATKHIGNLKAAPEITCEQFLSEIVPKAQSIELLMENRLEANMVSLLAPVNADSPTLFKWDNGFSWAYNGDVADSMKARVQAAGGKIDGVLRFSIQWNECGTNNVDFDAHCYEPGGLHIYYGREYNYASTGRLDVDITQPRGKIAVENITWRDPRKMADGRYEFFVHNYSSIKSSAGFTAEIEFNNQVHKFIYDAPLESRETIKVATVTKADIGFTIEMALSSTYQSRDVWGIRSETYCKVALIMNSPNYWADNKVGNKHLFFILDGCNSGDEARGFYNEFLRSDLNDHRKTFELLGSEMKAQKSAEQVSGLGFSSTQRNHVFCRVTGAASRVFKLTF